MGRLWGVCSRSASWVAVQKREAELQPLPSRARPRARASNELREANACTRAAARALGPPAGPQDGTGGRSMGYTSWGGQASRCPSRVPFRASLPWRAAGAQEHLQVPAEAPPPLTGHGGGGGTGTEEGAGAGATTRRAAGSLGCLALPGPGPGMPGLGRQAVEPWGWRRALLAGFRVSGVRLRGRSGRPNARARPGAHCSRVCQHHHAAKAGG